MGVLKRLLRIALPVAAIFAPFILGSIAAAATAGLATTTPGLAAGIGLSGATGVAVGSLSSLSLGTVGNFARFAVGASGAAQGGGAAGGGGLGALFGSGAAGGSPSLFQVGGTLLKAVGGLQQSKAEADFFRSQQQIAALNSAQIKELLPLQLEAFDKEAASIAGAEEIRLRKISEARDRANRQGAFVFEGLERAEDASALGEVGIRERSNLASALVTTQLGNIIERSVEKIRQIDVQQGRVLGTVSQAAARGGTRVGGGSAETVRGEVRLEAGKAVEEVQRESDQAFAEAALTEEARLSQVREQLSVIALKNQELEQQRRETQQGLEDATFDAAIELEITERNADIALERVEFNKVLAQKRADIEGLQQDILAKAAADQARARALAGKLTAAEEIARGLEFERVIGAIGG